ncbi:MAG: oligosaccharide flippase family protein [Proteobacteria bacterium]|nr:oligosaccharide flippase family protein [Pseudomonadota bacterium]
MKSDLKTDTLLYGAATLIERVLGLVLLPVLTRRLTGDEYGIWAQSAVVSSVLMPLVTFGLPAAVVRHFSAGIDGAQRRRWMLRTLGLAASLYVLLGGCAWLARDAVAAGVYGSATQSSYVALLVILLAADALFDLLVGYLRAAFRMRLIALMIVARGLLRVGLMLAALDGAGWSFAQAFAALVLLQLGVVASVYAVELLRRAPAVATPPTSVTWHALLTFSAPLVLVSLLTSANGFADRFVLTHLLGLASVAVYAAVASLVGITSVAYTVLGFTLFPVLSRLWSQGASAEAELLATDAMRVFLFLALPVALWLPCVTDSLLPLLATQAYRAPAAAVLLLGLGAVGFGLYQIVLYLLLIAGRGLRAAWLMAVAAVLNAVLNVVLVPRLGLTGAALAASVSNGLLAVLAHAAAPTSFPWASALRIGGAALLAAAVLLALGHRLTPASWTSLAASVAGTGLLYLALDLAPGRSMIRAFVLRRGAP